MAYESAYSISQDCGFIRDPSHRPCAYGETYLNDEWKHDLIAVADYAKVDAGTLSEQIREGWEVEASLAHSCCI